MQIKKTLIKETVILAAAILLGVIITIIGSNIEFLQEFPAPLAILLPYLLVLSYRLVRLIVKLLKTNPTPTP